MDATEELPAAGSALVLGRYRLGRRLGAGGFGTVFAARDERLGRRVAGKVMARHGPAPERSRREALAAARLDHPGVVAVFDAGEDAGGRYLVSELVRGRTLADLEGEGALGDRDVLRVGLVLADALAHAHGRGVVHRDVKPQNVIVPDEASDAAAKLTDFGIAHLAGDEPLTMTGDVVGTLAYMAPEQAAGERVDERVDLYALGLVLYEALAGVHPVRGATPAATARLVGTELTPLARQRRDLPAELCAAIDRVLAPRPDDRGTLAELTEALAAALTEVPDDGHTIAPHPLEREDAPSHPLLVRALAGIAAGGLAAAAAAAAGEAPPAAALAAAVAVALLPRAGWLLAAAGCVAVLAAPRPELAVLVAAAAAAPPLLLRRHGLVWSLPALAPLLGLATLAGAYPAVAGRLRRPYARAAAGAVGAWWLLLAEAGATLEAVVTSGALLVAPVWAAAALVLPWLAPGRSLARDVAGGTAWAAGLGAATAAVAEQAGLPEPRGLAAGAVAAGVLAVVGGRARGTVEPE